MADKNRPCMIETDEEDEDGNLTSGKSGSSISESDEDFEVEKLTEGSSENNEVSNEELDIENLLENGKPNSSVVNNKSDENKDEENSATSRTKYIENPTPRCDFILREYYPQKQNIGSNLKKKKLQDSKPSNNSEDKNSSDLNEMDIEELNSQCLQTTNKIEEVEENTDSKITHLLVVKKEEEIDVKFKIEEDIKEEIETVSIENQLVGFMNINKTQDSSEGNKSTQHDAQSKTKGVKRKNEDDDDPSYTPKTKKQFSPSGLVRNRTSKTDNVQSSVIAPRKRGRPPKYKVLPQAERNEKSQNSLSSVVQVHEKDSANPPKALTGQGHSQRNIINVNSPDLQPFVLLVPLKLHNSQLTEPKKRGRPPKAEAAKSFKHSQKQSSTMSTEVVNLELEENDSDLLVNSLLKTDDYTDPTSYQENVFDKNDLFCLQQPGNPVMSSPIVQMTAFMTEKETKSIIEDYLISHQTVFDVSFFQNILPVLSDMLMLCMDEFTELLVRSKKAEHFTSEELRQQEIKLVIQSFFSMVSTCTEKFFPNFNSVIYKINKNKTKKGLVVTLILFLANSLWIRCPKFKGLIYTMRKMLLCMYQIRKINSPLFLAMLTTPEKKFNDDLKVIIKILLFLQKKSGLTIPATVFPETSSNDSIEETCEFIISWNTCVSSDSVYTPELPGILAQFVEDLQDNKQQDSQEVRENLSHILCLFKQNNPDSKSEIPGKSIFESGLNHSLTQQDRDQVLAESLEHDQLDSFDNLFESYLKSARNCNDDVKAELGMDCEDTVLASNDN